MTTMEQSVGAGVYAGRIARTLNSGFIALMISVGHRTRLFDVLAALPPSTSAQIARAAGLAERYVREWLAAMTSAHIIDYDARTATYFLPIEYAAVLSRMAGTDNLAPAAQMLSLLAGIEDLVVAGFQGGGGVMPEAYERLRETIAAGKQQQIDESYVDALLDLVPGLRTRLESGATVLDAGCGDGLLLVTMARMFPRTAFRGYDLAVLAIERACERVDEAGLRNVEFSARDLTDIDEVRAYDLVLAFGSLHQQIVPAVVLGNIAGSLKRDGVLLMQEVAASSHLSRNVDHPFAPMLYALSCMHDVPVATRGEDSDALGLMWGQERALQMLRAAGFGQVHFETLPGEAMSAYCVARK